MRIAAPDGRLLLDVETKGRLRGYGLTELVSESSEPPFATFPLAEFKQLFPEGRYRFSGRTIGGRRVVGQAHSRTISPRPAHHRARCRRETQPPARRRPVGARRPAARGRDRRPPGDRHAGGSAANVQRRPRGRRHGGARAPPGSSSGAPSTSSRSRRSRRAATKPSPRSRSGLAASGAPKTRGIVRSSARPAVFGSRGVAPHDRERAACAGTSGRRALRHVARFLSDRPADVGLDGQLVRAVAHGHERAPEATPVDRPAHLDEARLPQNSTGSGQTTYVHAPLLGPFCRVAVNS